MNKHLQFNENYRIHTFYSEDVHESIPSGCIQITEEVWVQIIERQQDYKVKDNLSTEIVYDNIDDVVYIEEAIPPTVIKDDMPTQDEIDFALYVLATEDRLSAIENMLKGGV